MHVSVPKCAAKPCPSSYCRADGKLNKKPGQVLRLPGLPNAIKERAYVLSLAYHLSAGVE